MEYEEGKTYKIRIMFEIDVPDNPFKSDLNTAVLLLSEISRLENCNRFEAKARNYAIERLKKTLDGLKIVEIEGLEE